MNSPITFPRAKYSKVTPQTLRFDPAEVVRSALASGLLKKPPAGVKADSIVRRQSRQRFYMRGLNSDGRPPNNTRRVALKGLSGRVYHTQYMRLRRDELLLKGFTTMGTKRLIPPRERILGRIQLLKKEAS